MKNLIYYFLFSLLYVYNIFKYKLYVYIVICILMIIDEFDMGIIGR